MESVNCSVTSESATPWTVARQAPLSKGLSRQKYWQVAISFSTGSSWPRDQTQVSCIAGRCFTVWATREAQGRGTRDQIANIRWTIEKAREFQKNIYFCFIDYAKAFGCVDHNKL